MNEIKRLLKINFALVQATFMQRLSAYALWVAFCTLVLLGALWLMMRWKG